MSDQFEGGITAADVADFLEKGLLENLVLLFKAEPVHYGLLTELLSGERMAVRIGTSALVETLAEEDREGAVRAVRALLPLLSHRSPVVRGDAAYLLGILQRPEALPALRALSDDANADVREAVSEALERIAP